MNAFANALFTLLLGWARSLLYSLFSALSSDTSRGALSWLGDHWLWLAAGLALLGTAIDFIVWLIRWQPYLVWRTRFRRFCRHVKGQDIEDKRFEKGYRDGVLIERQETAAPEPTGQEQRFTRVGQEPYAPPPPESQPVWTRVVSSAPPVSPAQQPLRQMMFEEEFTSRPQPPARQKRRSDKYRQGLFGAVNAVKSRLNDAQEEEEEMLSGLPPAVDKGQAFREPVYPKYNDAGRGAP